MTFRPTVTSQPIILSTNFMTFIPILSFTELWVVSKEHLQRMGLASRERLPFPTPGSVPQFGTFLCPNCWDQIPRTCHVFTRLFTLNTPCYFLDFAFVYKAQVHYCDHALSVGRPLLTFHIVDFSKIAKQNLPKIDEKQELNVLYQICVFRSIGKPRWLPWPLLYWDISTFSLWGAVLLLIL